jgi:hypothetical protein
MLESTLIKRTKIFKKTKTITIMSGFRETRMMQLYHIPNATKNLLTSSENEEILIFINFLD